MPIPAVTANLFGDFDSRDLTRPALEVPQADLWQALQQVLDYYNGLFDDIFGLIATRGTTVQEGYAFGGGGGLLQRGAEYGQALVTRVEAAEFNVAYPIERFRTRVMFTPEFLLRAEVRHVQAASVQAMIQDVNTQAREILSAIFNNANYTFTDPKDIGMGAGDLTIRRLFNADSIPGTIFRNGSTITMGALNHYKTSGAASMTNGVFTLGYDTLEDLGLDGNIIAFISKADETAVSNLSNFVAKPLDPNIVLQDINVPAYSIVRNPRAIGRVKINGATSIEIVVLDWMPGGYVFFMDTTADKPVFVRESDLPQLRGFRLTGNEVVGNIPLDGPVTIVNKYWERIFGVGIRNRGNGCVVQVTTSGTYTPPNFYA